MPLDKVEFKPNQSRELCLKFDTGKPCKGYGGVDQVYFTVMDEHGADLGIFVPPHVERRFRELNLRAHERFEIGQVSTKQGNRRTVDWYVRRVDPPTPQAAIGQIATPAAAGTYQNGQQANPSIPPVKLDLKTAFTRFLIDAQEAVAAAEADGARKGLAYRYDNRDVAAAATSMFIHAGNKGWLCFASSPEKPDRGVQ